MDLFNDFSIGLFFWQFLIFIGLVLLLRKFAWKPILDAVNEREESIKNALESAEQAKLEMEKLKAGNEDLIKEAREERDNLLKEARELKDKMIADAKNDAKEEAARLLANAREDIKNEKLAAIAELKNHVANLSIDIAQKVVKEELGKEKHQTLIEKSISEANLN